MAYETPLLPDTRAVRARFAGDIHRPRYHFLPPSNWTNDPNGVIQWQGQYHLFYQHNPGAPVWGDMHWGHAASPDLVHWVDWPIALAPTPGSYDEAGVYSGCAVDDNGVPTVIYTGTTGPLNTTQVQCLATSHDGLLTWQKHPRNPVLTTIPQISGQTQDFRDPFVWKEGDRWLMVLGSRIQDVGGVVFLYQSANLTDWEYLHPLLVGDSQRNGVIWECPNFFRLGDEWVLIVSSHLGKKHMTDKVLYFVGSFENDQFTPVYEGVLDYDRLYAPLSLVDDQGRRILFGWMRESRDNDALMRAGWGGAMSIPRVLTLDDQHRLQMTPVPELAAIRGAHTRITPQTLDAEIPVAGLALDIEARFQPGDAETCGVSVLFSPSTDEKIDVLYDTAAGQLVVRKTVLDAGRLVTTTQVAPHAVAAGAPLDLRILLDGSVVEVIVDTRTSLSTRIYPSSADGAVLTVVGPNESLVTLDLWQMPSIWQ